MEAIFAQMTFAYETLSSVERRAEYDAYLSTQKQTRSMEDLLRSATAPAPPGFDPERFTPVPSVSSPPPEAMSSRSEPAMANPTSTVPARSPETDRARREALARKLGIARASVPPDAGRSSSPPSPTNLEAATHELKRRHDAILGEGRRAQVRRYVEAANEAMKTNPAAAANAYRLALTLDPENPEIVAAHKEAAKLAAVALADGYLKQADYESRTGQWVEAARSYLRAAAGMPNDAVVLQKTAHALVKSAGDMHQAADLAKRAIALSPKRVEPRLTLTEVYIAAGLPMAAKRELDAAREIAPQDDKINELSKRLK
jgi:tetratricopeptide (TPR) repeat protein